MTFTPNPTQPPPEPPATEKVKFPKVVVICAVLQLLPAAYTLITGLVMLVGTGAIASRPETSSEGGLAFGLLGGGYTAAMTAMEVLCAGFLLRGHGGATYSCHHLVRLMDGQHGNAPQKGFAWVA